MRILLVGQAAFAEEVLRGLEAAGDTIAAVVCPPDAAPKPDPLKAAAHAPRVPVDESGASYDPLCRDEHARIDWSRPAAEVHNLIRGCDPQPGAHTVWRGAPLRLYEPRRVEAPAGAVPGTVVSIGAEGLTVA